MIKMPYEDVVKKIVEATGKDETEIQSKIKAKMDALSGLVSKEGAAYIIANETGVKLAPEEGKIKIKDILVGMRSVETVGKVTRKFPINEFERQGNKGKVGSFFISDETSQIKITAWHEMTDHLEKFDEGDIVQIIGGYVRENNGFKEIHLNNMSKVVINPEGVEIEAKSPVSQNERKKISELLPGDENVEIFGTVVQVFEPRFWPACPECNKKVIQEENGFNCGQHGSVEPVYSYVLNAVIDDGSDNMRITFFKNQILNMFKVIDEEMQAVRNEPQKFEPYKTDALGEMVKVIGRVSRNEMFDRTEMVARTVERDVNPDSEIAKLKQSDV